MTKKKKLPIIFILIALSSQLYIDFNIPNFKFSFAAVIFPVFLYVYNKMNPIFLGVFSGASVYLMRIIAFIISNGNIKGAFSSYIPEMLFYIFYGIIFYIYNIFNSNNNIGRMFFVAILGDFCSNFLEIYIRIGNSIFRNFKTIQALILAAVIRAGIMFLILIVLKYYRMFLIKQEHEERYRRLLWLTSRLKTEVYWMEKNMDNVEKVMSNSYELFTKISNNEEKESWGNRSLEIAKDVHELKKEYSLIVRGLDEILANRLDDNGMNFHELAFILKESMDTEIRYTDKDIYLDFKLGDDFFTEEHYYLMSVFRNIITNGIDSIEKEGMISLIHKEDEENHIFIIKDNGFGISGEDLSHIYSPGFSTKVDYVTGQVNRGLGLSLVKNIVEVHFKGDITVRSNVGEGTIFTIIIPKIELEA